MVASTIEGMTYDMHGLRQPSSPGLWLLIVGVVPSRCTQRQRACCSKITKGGAVMGLPGIVLVAKVGIRGLFAHGTWPLLSPEHKRLPVVLDNTCVRA